MQQLPIIVVLLLTMSASCSVAIDVQGEPCTDGTDCDPGQSCLAGECVDGCQDECTPAGISECRGNVIYECEDDGGCKRFEEGDDCKSSGESCLQFDGYAQCGPAPCSNACYEYQAGETGCYADQFRTECRFTENQCWEWDAIEDCYETSPDATCDDQGGSGTSTCVVPCENQCEESHSRCLDSVRQTCALFPDGCTYWLDDRDCADTQQTCIEPSETSASCSGQCRSNCMQYTSYCEGNAIMDCHGMGGDPPCYYWRPSTDCSLNGESCVEEEENNASCQFGCLDPCETVDATQCAGTVIQTCTAVFDGCDRWLDGEDCADDELSCIAHGSAPACLDCTDGCPAGETQCAGEVIQSCVVGTSGCLEWSDGIDCAGTSEFCNDSTEPAVCELTCTDRCGAGEERCENEMHQECAEQGTGCTDWNVLDNCGVQGEVCRDSVEGPGCHDCSTECQLGATRCNGTVIEECQVYEDPCHVFADPDGVGDCSDTGQVCIFDGDNASCCDPECGEYVCGLDPGGCETLCGVCTGGPFCQDGLCEPVDWVTLAGATYSMGTGSGEDNEAPGHDVVVPSFDIMRTEVTVRHYVSCVQAGTCAEPTNQDPLCNYDAWRLSHPMNCVTWDMARDCCTYLGGRLPSEAEWEFAARDRGQNLFEYPWGSTPEPDCVRVVMWDGPPGGCGTGGSLEVGSKPEGATPDGGLVDMAGNVEEWVQDDYHGTYDGAPGDGTAWDDGGSDRVIRGGTYLTQDALDLRTRRRWFYLDSTNSPPVGFRCAR